MNEPLHPHFPYDDTETTESYLRRLSQYHTGRNGRHLLADFGIKLRIFIPVRWMRLRHSRT